MPLSISLSLMKMVELVDYPIHTRFSNEDMLLGMFMGRVEQYPGPVRIVTLRL